jgi:DNA (cytosine-5)-methyltransferase 1
MNTFYEFFAGGGMARAGLGPQWRCLMANDFCSKKAKAYISNWGNDHFVLGDIKGLKLDKTHGQTDLAWASFPCQDLSLAGTGVGLNGKRSGTFWAFWKIIRSLNRQCRKPLIVVIENVYGTLTSNDGKDFEAIAKAIAKEGYNFGAMIIDAALFVPHSRPRFFMIALDSHLDIPAGITLEKSDPMWHPVGVIEAYKRLVPNIQNRWLWWNLTSPPTLKTTLDDIIEVNPTGVDWHTNKETRCILNMMSIVNRKKILAIKKSGRLRVGTLYKRTRNGMQRAEARFDGIAGCLRTPKGGSSRQTIIIVDGNEVRTRLLSPREAARLMGLPETYKLPYKYNDAYHLIGDGVAVPVVRHIASSILEPILENNRTCLLKKAI